MSGTVFIDADVFLRFFTLDDGGQHIRAAELFQRAADGNVALVAAPPVLFEVAWTLRSSYHLSRERVLGVLSAILAFPRLRLVDRNLVEEAISLARRGSGEFADAYIAAVARQSGADEIATFDRKHFEKLGATIGTVDVVPILSLSG